MKHTAKKIIPWVIAIIVFLLGFYLTTQRQLLVENRNLTMVEPSAKADHDHQELALKQKLIDDFENAFLKQYTPILGCEEILNENQSAECSQHLEQAKNDFKEEFIKNRGLPKNTFEELKLSFVE